MRKNLFFSSVFLLIFVLVCTRPPRESIEGTYDPKTLFWLPKQHDFEQTKTFDCRFDEVWSALTDVLYESDLSIKSWDKASGIIALQDWTTTDTLI